MTLALRSCTDQGLEHCAVLSAVNSAPLMPRRNPKPSTPPFQQPAYEAPEVQYDPGHGETDLPPTEATSQAVNQAAIEAMALGVDAIRAQIDAIKRGDGGESKYDTGSRIAFLAKQAGSIYEATRKAEAARLKSLSKLSPAIVLAWYRALDASDREHIRRELEMVDAKRNGLA